VVENQTDNFIPNDTRLSRTRQMLLITGPNMGGKSTYMRQTALIVLLAHCGSFVPAASARIGPIDQIFTRIGASDDLAGGRSTFMVEMTETANILHNATENSLVLLDEIGRGTSTFDGLALAWAIARQLIIKTQCHTLFATHYFELTQLAQEFRQVANVHLDAVEHRDHIVFLHSVEEGPASQSYGLQVAQLAGVPAVVIQQAKKRLLQLEQQGITASPQGDLFATAPTAAEEEEHPALETLRQTAPDDLSPKAALELIYQLKKMVIRNGEERVPAFTNRGERPHELSGGAVVAVGMLVSNFILARGTHFANGAFEQQALTSQGMVAIHHHLVVRHVGHGVKNPFVVIAIRRAFELHPNFHLLVGKLAARLDADQVGVIFAKGMLGFQRHLAGFAHALALQRLFHGRENAVITAMQIADRLIALLQHFTRAIAQFVTDGHNSIFCNFHACSRGCTRDRLVDR
jgi:hypothetical protein